MSALGASPYASGMDIQTIDQSYQSLQAQAQQTRQAVNALNGKLQAAGAAGDQSAREWSLDLRELALTLQAEQDQVGQLLQALHDFVLTNAHQPVAQIVQDSAVYAPQLPARGGLLSRFTGGGFGQSMGGGGFKSALMSGAGMGLGIGAGEALIGDLFD